MWREQPSQSKSSILPALPKGEPSVVLFIYVLQQKPLPEGEASVLFFVLVCNFFPFKTKNA